MDLVLASKPPCPGIRFYPSDEELFMYYLKRKVMGKSFPYQMMSDVDVYRCAPWDLPGKSCLNTRDLYWYFFCPRVKKYASGARAHRLTEFGFWKSTGNDRSVQYRGRPVGKIKTLVFHRGKPPGGDRTNWVMHEYKLEDQRLADKGVSQDSYVICKIYEKSGLGPKNGEDYGAPFVEEEWESDGDNNMQTDQVPVLHPENVVPADNTNALSTPCSLVPSSTEQLTASVTAACTPSTTTVITTEQTAPVTEQVPPNEPQADRLGAMIDNDFFNGLDDIIGSGSHSAAHLNLSQWPSYHSPGYIELDDFSRSLADSDWSHFNWLLQPADDITEYVELNDLN